MPKILISLILLGLSFVLGVIFLWPRYQELGNIRIGIENKKQEIQNLDKYYKELSSISEKLEEHQEELAKIDSVLSSYFSAPSFLRFLQKIAPENGLILASVNFSGVQSLPERVDIKEIMISLEVSGSYSSLKNFLKTLEQSSRLIEINNISFSTSEDEEGKVSEIFKFRLGIKTYSY